MRIIEDLRNKHEGEEIWILGTGPSLDDYPKDFFRGKITIALKYAVAAFPHHTYSMCNLVSLKMNTFLKKHPHLYKTHIFPQHKGSPLKGKYRNHPFYMEFRSPSSPGQSPKARAFLAVETIMNREPAVFTGGSRIAHWAIQVAAILGAKRITLVGCEDKCRKYGCYAKRVRAFYYEPMKIGHQIRKAGHKVPHGGLSSHQIEDQWNTKDQKEARDVTRLLAKALKVHGVELVLYHHKKTSQYKKGYLKLA